jgi:hypothetical protein
LIGPYKYGWVNGDDTVFHYDSDDGL